MYILIIFEPMQVRDKEIALLLPSHGPRQATKVFMDASIYL